MSLVAELLCRNVKCELNKQALLALLSADEAYWNFNGVMHIIPREVLKNLQGVLQDQEAMVGDRVHQPPSPSLLLWSQTRSKLPPPRTKNSPPAISGPFGHHFAILFWQV